MGADNPGYFVEVDGVLENKLGITDPAELEAREYDITAQRISEILLSKIPEKPDFNYLLELHRRLFEDVYDFAGKTRTVNISKPDSPVPFCYADFILPESERIFVELARSNFLVGLEKEEFIGKLAWLSSELNALHPFREGNGRTTRLYLMLLSKKVGYILDFNLIIRDRILDADRVAFAGDLEPLKNLYSRIVQKI